jgi:uncharacterized protein YeaO (DUF488 family)
VAGGVRVRRVYQEPSERDGTRVLVDRVWPRGLRQPDQEAALARLRGLARDTPVTLLTATRDPDISQAAVLADLLRGG